MGVSRAGLVFGLVLSLCGATQGKAADRAPTVFLQAGAGFYSHDSEFVESKDASYSFSYTLGVNGGSNKQIGVYLNNSTTNTSFELNTSELQIAFQDMIFRYALGPIYFGLVIGQANVIATRPATEGEIDIDAAGTGFGGVAGGEFSLSKRSSLFFDVSSVSISTVKEVNDSAFAIGSRLDISFGGVFLLTKQLIGAFAGVTRRTYSLTLDGTSGAEELMMTRFGLRLNYNL